MELMICNSIPLAVQLLKLNLLLRLLPNRVRLRFGPIGLTSDIFGLHLEEGSCESEQDLRNKEA